MTFLDLLVIVVMALVAVSMVSVALMFLVKNSKVQKISFYIVAILGIYMGTVGVRILFPGFIYQVILAVALMLVSVGAIVLYKKNNGNDKMFLYAKVMASLALVAGMLNAFM